MTPPAPRRPRPAWLHHAGDYLLTLVQLGRIKNRGLMLEERTDELQRRLDAQQHRLDAQQHRLDAAEQALREHRQALHEADAQRTALAQRHDHALQALARAHHVRHLELEQRLVTRAAPPSAALAPVWPAAAAPCDPLAPEIAADPANLDLVTHPFTLTYLGPFRPEDGQHRLIDVLYTLVRAGIGNLRLVLASPAPAPAEPAAPPDDALYLAQLQVQVALLGLTDGVSITPALAQPAVLEAHLATDVYLSMAEAPARTRPQAVAALVRALAHQRLVLVCVAHPHEAAQLPWLPDEALCVGMTTEGVAAALTARLHDAALRTRQRHAQAQRWHARAACAPDSHLPDPRTPGWAVAIEGPFASTYSLALVNTEIAEALHAQGDRVALKHTDGCGDTPADAAFLAAHPVLAQLARTPLQRIDVVLRNVYPPRTHAMPGRLRLFGPYGWEESAFPAAWIEGFNRRLDGVLCMSAFVRDTLIANGLAVPTFVTGIVADQLLRQAPLDPGIALPPSPRLLHVSSCFPRKGVDVLLAVLDRLPDGLNLVIKTFPNPHNQLADQLARLGYDAHPAAHAADTLYTKAGRRVLVIARDLAPAHLAWLYRHADALVAPSRGEGFGLPMAEAMLMDLPVVTTDYGGHTDFCTADTVWQVRTTLQPAHTHFDLPGSHWAEPDPPSLAAAIDAALGAAGASRHARLAAARQRIQRDFSRAAVAQRLHAAFQTLAAER